jgi:hypothetical protein
MLYDKKWETQAAEETARAEAREAARVVATAKRSEAAKHGWVTRRRYREQLAWYRQASV